MPRPVLQALVLANHVYKDAFTGKMVIAARSIGCARQEQAAGGETISFAARRERPSATRRDAPQQPGGPRKLKATWYLRVGSTAAYISLTEVRGTVPLELHYVDLADNRTVLRWSLPSGAMILEHCRGGNPHPPMLAPHVGVFLSCLSDNQPGVPIARHLRLPGVS